MRTRLRAHIIRFTISVTTALPTIGCGGGDGGDGEAVPDPWFVESTPEPSVLDMPPGAIPPIDDEPTAVAQGGEGGETERPDPFAEAAEAPAADRDEPPPLAPSEEVAADGGRTVDIVVERNESIKLYSEWAGVPESELLPNGGLTRPKLRAGQRLALLLTPDAYRRFTDGRDKYRLEREREFLQRFEVERLEAHTVAKGDNVWKIANKHGEVPVWVLKRFNRNVDLEHLKLGDVVLVPVLNQVAPPGKKAGEMIWDLDAEAEAMRRHRDGQKPANVAVKVPGAKEEKPLPAGTTVKVKRGETMRLYAQWSNVPVETIRRMNPGIGGRGLQLDQLVRIPMTDARFVEFVQLRNQFHGDLMKGEVNEASAPEERDEDAGMPVYGKGVKLVRHSVKRGETLAKIAKSYKVTVKAIKAANPNRSWTRLDPGDTLKVPVKKQR